MSGDDGLGLVERGRAAAAGGDWQEAFELLTEADAAGFLIASDLRALAEVAYAAGRLDTSIATYERAHTAFLRADDQVAAAEAAVRVAMHLLFDTTLMAPVRGWLTRAEGLLAGRDAAPAYAWLAVVRAYERLLTGDLSGAHRWARRAIETGSADAPAAAAIGRVAEARLIILDGEVQRGMTLLDEAGAAALSGDLDALSTGVVYCELVCALQGLAQYDVAEEWTEAMERWCEQNAIGSLHGRCRVHRAEILRLRGACGEAEDQALMAYEELRVHLRRELGWPLYELGRIRLHRGDIAGAEEALLAAHGAGWDPQPGLALVRLAQGDADSATEALREALERPMRLPSKERPPHSDLQRAPLLEALVETAVAAGRLGHARVAADELERIAARFASKALVAGAGHARGRVRLADGDLVGAEESLSEAVRLWHEVGAPYEAARARLDLAGAHASSGNEHRSALERQAARTVLDGMATLSAVTAAESLDHPAPVRPEVRAVGAGVGAGVGADVFCREGDYWTVTFEGHTDRIRDLKGMRYLARLLAEPGREFHVLDLVAAETAGGARGDPGSTAARSRSGLGDAGELLDPQARRAYRRRLTEIDDDLEQAERAGDSERAAQAAAERDFLVRELARAFGLSGRERRASSASERARASVTRAVRQAIARIGEHQSELTEHLRRTVRTGTYCAYLPDPRASSPWQLERPRQTS